MGNPIGEDPTIPRKMLLSRLLFLAEENILPSPDKDVDGEKGTH